MIYRKNDRKNFCKLLPWSECSTLVNFSAPHFKIHPTNISSNYLKFFLMY